MTQGELLTPMLRIIHRVIARFLLKQAGLKRAAADTGAVAGYLPGGLIRKTKAVSQRG